MERSVTSVRRQYTRMRFTQKISPLSRICHKISFEEDIIHACVQYYSNGIRKPNGRFSTSSSPPPLSQGAKTKSDEPKNERRGPIRLKDTPRNAAAAKARGSISVVQPTTPVHALWSGCVDTPITPFRLDNYGDKSLYTLILLRHGESEWNHQNRYTGWCDVELTERGKIEARAAGRLLLENNIEIDHAFTSVLKRALVSCSLALETAQQHWVPLTKSWRLNERHYGSLQGYNKDTAWKELGLDQELVMQMRRAYDVRPPRMEDDHPFWHGKDRRYRKLNYEQLESSRAESLKDTAARIMPFFNSIVIPSMRAGNNCLIVSHANTIRTLVKEIDNISDEDIKGLTIPTGIPLLYRLDENMRPVDPQMELEFRYMVEPKGYTWGTSRAQGFHGVYLGDLERLQDIQRKRDITNRDWQRIILRKIGKSLGWDFGDEPKVSGTSALASGPRALETRQLWWQVHTKKEVSGYSNMLLLVKMEEALEDLMYNRKQKFITKAKYEELINKIHLDTAGTVVEPFVALADRGQREQRERQWYETLALELEEEALIK